jgi:hypothetical protein
MGKRKKDIATTDDLHMEELKKPEVDYFKPKRKREKAM